MRISWQHVVDISERAANIHNTLQQYILTFMACNVRDFTYCGTALWDVTTRCQPYIVLRSLHNALWVWKCSFLIGWYHNAFWKFAIALRISPTRCRDTLWPFCHAIVVDSKHLLEDFRYRGYQKQKLLIVHI